MTPDELAKKKSRLTELRVQLSFGGNFIAMMELLKQIKDLEREIEIAEPPKPRPPFTYDPAKARITEMRPPREEGFMHPLGGHDPLKLLFRFRDKSK